MAKGVKKDSLCRFGCRKRYGMEWARNNHETHCAQNPNKGRRAVFHFDGKKWIYDGLQPSG